MIYSAQALKRDLSREIKSAKLKRPAITLFLEEVRQLLKVIKPAANEKEVQLHLQEWIADTAFARNYTEPETYDSPVCYASANGLREGFNMDESAESSQLLPEPSFAYNSIANWEDSNRYSKEMVQVTRLWLSEVVRSWEQKQPAISSDVTKQIEQLVYQLYGLNPIA